MALKSPPQSLVRRLGELSPARPRPTLILAKKAGTHLDPVPLEQWPLFCKVIAQFRKPNDCGVGDTVVHLIGDTRSTRFKQWFTRKFGRTCGCEERQRWLNVKYPYAKS